MKILQLRSENIKKLKVVDITPENNMVVISGKNGAGKSSVLDSIEYALSGDRSLPERPIRDGETKAVINIDLGEYKIKKVITENTTRLEVKTKEGYEVKSAQTLLNDIIGKLTFDPLKFVNMEKDVQRNLLLKLAGIDFTALDAERKVLYDERTIINREGNTLKAKYDSFNSFVEEIKSAPGKKVDIADVSKELSVINIQINICDSAKESIVSKNKDKNDLQEEIKKLEDDLKAKREKLDAVNQEIERHTQVVEIGEVEKIYSRKSEIEAILNSAEAENNKYQVKQEFLETERQYKAKKEEYANKDAAITAIENKKKNLIENSIMPVPGLSFNDETVLYNGIPFAQLSSAMKIRVSVGMAMAMNSKLRVIMIREGSLLDSESMKIIEEMAIEKDYDVWVEKVDESGDCGIVIEEGEVKSYVEAVA